MLFLHKSSVLYWRALMAITVVGYTELLLALLCFLFLFHHSRKKKRIITNWPLVGMVPGLVRNAHCIHEYLTDLVKDGSGTFEIKGPWLFRMDTLLTSDPANFHHILNKSFSNFHKGSDHREIFDILGDGILNSDSDSWKSQRRITQGLMKHANYRKFLEGTARRKVERGLSPVLEHFAERGTVLDLQDLFKRFTFDEVCIIILGFDPKFLSVEYPEVPSAKAFTEIEEALLYRHILPQNVWKLQRWLQIGKEKTIIQGRKILDEFLMQCISSKRKTLKKPTDLTQSSDLLTAYIQELHKSGQFELSDQFLRDFAINLMVAGRDTVGATLTWFFYLLGKNPSVESKIRDEINTKLPIKEGTNDYWGFSSTEELTGLVYLHGALCETLRLYPAVALQHRSAVTAEILPSGHRVRQKTRVVLSLYSMGRLEAVWGEDCLDFKPERWVSGRGETVHVPSYNTAFSAGPRSCLGKELTFIQMKIVVIAMIRRFRVEMVEDQCVAPSNSVLLDLKYGLKARVSRI